MNYFIQNIHINKLLHLQDFDIPIANEKTPHLILTGKNGTGKTILLKAIAAFLEELRTDKNLNLLHIENYIKQNANFLQRTKTDAARVQQQNSLKFWENKYNEIFGKVALRFNDIYKISELTQNNEFIFAFYEANRKPTIVEPTNPTKPHLYTNRKITDITTNQLLLFLSDLKIQEALARNEQQISDAEKIHQWFDEFEQLLKEIYQDKHLQLVFNYKDYTFKINTNGKSFKFNEMSDGYIAAIDIIADLILKMQDGKSLVHNYQKQGIVLIDEIETHLHLELQRLVMPLLTRIFPNIQFIVTTHSPFVLSSMPNAIAYDLEHREVIDKLTEYSYESLAEGYFGVKTDSSYVEMKLKFFKDLLEKKTLTQGDAERLLNIIADFDKIPEAVSPTSVGEFRRLKVEYSDKIKTLK